MKKMSGADIVVRALEDEGIRWTFGIPGIHNIELYDALQRSQSVKSVLVTDEQSASFMADGVSRSSGELGCVNLVPGAGLTHALSGIAEAFMDGIPLLVLACGIRRDTDKAYQLHDIDQLAVARPVTKAQLAPESGAEIYRTIRKACLLARKAPQGPVIVEIPVDHYMSRHRAELEAPEEDCSSPIALSPEILTEVRALLEKSRRPLIYLGLGAGSAGGELVRLAEQLQAPVATTFQGKGVFPENHPLWLWCGFGATAPPFARKIAADCDMTLAIGCRFSEVGTGGYGIDPPAPMVHVDIDKEVLNRNYPAKIAIEADSKVFVSGLLEILHAKSEDSKLIEKIRSGQAAVREGWLADEKNGQGVAPPRLLRALQEAFGSDTVFTTDSGNGTFLAMECLRLEMPRSYLSPIDYSCMGYSVPAALGAALACPDRPVVALAGDGAFLMTGLELLTASQLQIPVAVLVLRDKRLAQIAQFQENAFAQTSASELPAYDLAALSRGLNVQYLSISQNDEITEALREARALMEAHGPVLVEVAIDYSAKTYFTKGVVRVTLNRLPWSDRLRFLARAITRRLPIPGH